MIQFTWPISTSKSWSKVMDVIRELSADANELLSCSHPQQYSIDDVPHLALRRSHEEGETVLISRLQLVSSCRS